ncbi:hypothetical protein ALC57_10773 [Trachymyrmex cornetzi]|uniref:Uncharacterized protein n=1 Tax=Trachymyrmex cornetzi TaxID=471704 RepID=A0A151J3C3_9HYME|nr:hypothetical protein ALC57_10773 [Trachymyrmex cornetzi]
MEFLSYLSPVLRIKIVISTTFICRCLFYNSQTWCLRYPNFFLHMISPLSAVSSYHIQKI